MFKLYYFFQFQKLNFFSFTSFIIFVFSTAPLRDEDIQCRPSWWEVHIYVLYKYLRTQGRLYLNQGPFTLLTAINSKDQDEYLPFFFTEMFLNKNYILSQPT